MDIGIRFDHQRVVDFCRKWRISRFSLFGSVLREDFGSDSDVDVLILFDPPIVWSLYDWVDMIEELQAMFGRKVDLVSEEGLRNPFRREEILCTRRVIYEAA